MLLNHEANGVRASLGRRFSKDVRAGHVDVTSTDASSSEIRPGNQGPAKSMNARVTDSSSRSYVE